MYKVLIDDNFHPMDESERTDHGGFATAEEAVAECKAIIDDNLESFKPRSTAQELFEIYAMFGDDPFIVGEPPVHFSAWDYARERCGQLAQLH